MIAHSARCFSDKAAIPVIRVEPVPDLDLSRHFRMMVKTAVTDDRVFATRHNGKLRRHTGAIPRHYFLDESDSLFPFAVNA
jgi:hypothetical protein